MATDRTMQNKLGENSLPTTVISLEKPIKTKTCAGCGQTKPIKSFQRRLTLAQSRAILKKPNISTRYTTTSKNCADCRRAKRRHSPLTIKDIRTKITSGDMHSQLGEALIKAKREAIPAKRSRIMKEVWEKRKGKAVVVLKANLQKQVDTYKNRYNAYKAQKTKDHALLEQHRWNYSEAKRVRNEIHKQLKAGENSLPIDFQLRDLFKRKEQV